MAQDDSNFRVFVRCRDGCIGESGPPGQPFEAVSSREIVRNSAPPKRYLFDRVFDERCDQHTIFEECAEPLIDDFLKGYNATLFAYGQTGTGKTYTITGDLASVPGSPKAGIVPRVLDTVFKRLATAHDWILELKYIELYNEELRDLLAPQAPANRFRSSAAAAQGPKTLRIVENKHSRSIEVMGAESVPVTNAEAALSLVRAASAKRQTATTQLNADSSRSHAVLTLVLVSREPVSGMAVRSKLHLVDLAGSENVARSGAVRARAQEAGEINKSLLSLGRIIEMLVSAEGAGTGAAASATTTSRGGGGSHSASQLQRPYISYRESKLTHLLQDSLGGTTKTCMVATVSLAHNSLEESKSTLEYASRARSIRNRPQTEVEVMEMQGTLKGLSKRLEEVQQELMMQRSRDGGVYVSNATYQQLKQGQRKHAELLAQREMAMKHHSQEIEDLRRVNQALRVELDSLRAESAALESQSRRLAAINQSNLENRECADSIVTMFREYSGKAEAVAETFSEQLRIIPTALEDASKQLKEIAQREAETLVLRAELGDGARKVAQELESCFKRQLKTILEHFDRRTAELGRTVLEKVNGAMTGVLADFKTAQDGCARLRRQIDTMQADMAIQRQQSAEAQRAATALQEHDEKFTSALAKLTEERRALLKAVVVKQERSALSRLSHCASDALDSVSTVSKAVSKPPASLPGDLAASMRAAQMSPESQAKSVAELDASLGSLDKKLLGVVNQCVDRFDQGESTAERTMLQTLITNLERVSASFQTSLKRNRTDTLNDKRVAIDGGLKLLQSKMRNNLATEGRPTSSGYSKRTPNGSPVRRRSPIKRSNLSPLRTKQQLLQSPTRGASDTNKRSPLRPLTSTNRLDASALNAPSSLIKDSALPKGKKNQTQPPSELFADMPHPRRRIPPAKRPKLKR